MMALELRPNRQKNTTSKYNLCKTSPRARAPPTHPQQNQCSGPMTKIMNPSIRKKPSPDLLKLLHGLGLMRQAKIMVLQRPAPLKAKTACRARGVWSADKVLPRPDPGLLSRRMADLDGPIQPSADPQMSCQRGIDSVAKNAASTRIRRCGATSTRIRPTTWATRADEHIRRQKE